MKINIRRVIASNAGFIEENRSKTSVNSSAKLFFLKALSRIVLPKMIDFLLLENFLYLKLKTSDQSLGKCFIEIEQKSLT